jgi:hypothetical protein
MMSETEFWKLIDESRKLVPKDSYKNGDEFQDRQSENLKAALRKLGPAAIEQFELRFLELRDRAYRWDIWGAAYWEGGGCGNDGFTDFRGNLVSLGKKMYESILKNPDNLADVLNRPDVPTLQGEGFAYIPGKLYQELTGREMELKDYPGGLTKPVGKKWDFEDEEEVARRLPKLYKKLPEGGG